MKDATLGQAAKIISLFDETSAEQVQLILGSGLLADLRDGKIIGEVNRDAFRALLGLPSLMPKLEPILKLLGTLTVPATTDRFVAKDRFVRDTSRKAKVKISWLGDNFKSWLLGKVEEPIFETPLRYHELGKPSVDGPIIAELGGEAKAETTLTAMFSLMTQQLNGESGALLTNGHANIFYIKDVRGLLCAVGVRWHDDGWFVNAHSVEDSDDWYAGYRVFSR